MVSGNAAVTHKNHDEGNSSSNRGAPLKIASITAGNISGELAMLGVSKVRAATVEAESICCMWEVSHDAALDIIDKMPEVRAPDIIVQHLQHAVPTLVDQLRLFK